MPKADITPQLADTLRNLRVHNKVQNKMLAEYIEKSPSYITKLEHGEIQTIDIDELSKIIHFITKESSDTKSAEQIYDSLQLHYSEEEIESQLWFTNFDTVTRQIPIPEELVEHINEKMNYINISRSYLRDRINANEALSDEEKINAIEYNHWYCSNDNVFKSNIKIHIEDSLLNGILDKTIDASSYIFVFAILFYVLKCEIYSSQVIITDQEYKLLYKETLSILNRYKFFSIAERRKLYREKTNTDFDELLNSFDKENMNYIQEILRAFIIATQYNIKGTNSQLYEFSKNLKWDLGFMLKLISMNYNSLTETSVKNKKELLNEIQKTIIKYSELPTDQNIIEEY